MVRKNISILDRNLQYVNMTSAVLGTTFSQVIADIIEYVRDNDLESDIWKDWDELYSAFEKAMKETFEKEDEEEEDEDEKKVPSSVKYVVDF